MKYSAKVYDTVKDTYAARRTRAEDELAARRKRLFAQSPELRELDRRIRKTASSVVEVILKGGRNGKQIDAIRQEVITLKAKRTVLLKALGEAPDALDIRYTCPKCEDSGYVDGKPCSCLEAELKATAFRLSQLGASLSDEKFSNFKLSYYADESDIGPTPRAIMKKNFEFCKSYAQNFGKNSVSLFMTGGVGLGKTHLASAIANELIARSFSVKYATAPEIFSSLEKDHFGRHVDEEDVDLISPDLLIIDDLGSEFVSSFTVSALFSTLNSRIIAKKPTVITTNLSPRDFEAQYGDKIYSRIAGDFMILNFKGQDIRTIKRKESLSK